MNNTRKHYEIGNATDVGKVRKINEDYYGKRDTKNGDIVLVCDGMGGHAGGEKASRLAVDSIINYLNDKVYQIPLKALSDSMIYANKVILDYAHQHPECKGMGSTCVALLIKNDYCYFAHVGDSRIYLYSDGILRQLTKDHSFVQSLVDAGALSEKEAKSHSRKNEITNALGLERMHPPSLCDEPYVPHKDDMVLLCSDGLTGMVRDDKINEILRSNTTLYDKAKELVAQANYAGGIDNVTVQIVQFSGGETGKKRIPVRNKMSRRTLSLTGIALFLTTVGFMASRSEYGQVISKNIVDFYNDFSGQSNKTAAKIVKSPKIGNQSKPTNDKGIKASQPASAPPVSSVYASPKIGNQSPTLHSKRENRKVSHPASGGGSVVPASNPSNINATPSVGEKPILNGDIVTPTIPTLGGTGTAKQGAVQQNMQTAP